MTGLATSAVLALALLGLLAGQAAASAADEQDHSIGAALDDECLADAGAGADGAGGCALNALQLRARRAESAEADCDSVWNNEACAGVDCHSCGERIDWLVQNQGLAKAQASTSVATEFAAACGACNPDPAAATAPAAGEGGCHDVTDDEPGPCLNGINWAKNVGHPQHPDWYPGLDAATATNADWQYFSWNTSHPTCPRPCNKQWDETWCDAPDAPELWKPASVSDPVQVKILSYNLFWWNLFNIRGGASAGQLIRATGEPDLYDVMGLQECEDPARVLGPAGLAGIYTAFNTSKATCMAYRTDTWKLLARGEEEVAMDMKTEYYGRRSAQWMRLQHKSSDMTLFFMNHHGPLSVNSGGACGGKATAHNLLKAMAKNGKPGDVLVLVGDFNANAASRTVQGLWTHLTHVYNSVSFGGVDNIFSNVPRSAVVETKDLGSGGSDHHAISATISLPADHSVAASNGAVQPEPTLAVQSFENAGGSDGCVIEPKGRYTYAAGAQAIVRHNIVDPRGCCNVCQGTGSCQSWTWEEWNVAARGPLCVLHGALPASTAAATAGFVSGLPKTVAVVDTERAATSA